MSSSRGLSNATALRRLMTEYKQLTSGGKWYDAVNRGYNLTHHFSACAGSPDGMFTAGMDHSFGSRKDENLNTVALLEVPFLKPISLLGRRWFAAQKTHRSCVSTLVISCVWTRLIIFLHAARKAGFLLRSWHLYVIVTSFPMETFPRLSTHTNHQCLFI